MRGWTKHQGYFEDEGLDVTFITGKGGVDVAKQVRGGRCQAGGRGQRAHRRGAGGHAHHRARQRRAHQGGGDSGRGFADFRRLAPLLATMQKAGLTRDDADIQAAGVSGAWQMFVRGKSQAISAAPDLIAPAEFNGAKLHWMDPAKGFPNMAQSIVASDQAIAAQPQMIGKLVRATLRGMKLIMDDLDTAVEVYVKAVPAHAGKEWQVRRIFELYRQHVYADQKVPGWIDAERLADNQAFYVSAGIVSTAVPLDDLFTNQFVRN